MLKKACTAFAFQLDSVAMGDRILEFELKEAQAMRRTHRHRATTRSPDRNRIACLASESKKAAGEI